MLFYIAIIFLFFDRCDVTTSFSNIELKIESTHKYLRKILIAKKPIIINHSIKKIIKYLIKIYKCIY